MRKNFAVLLAIFLLGCSKLHPYQVDIQQGNVINQEKISQLHVGLDKEEVKSILGKSLVSDGFSPNTWTYVYTNQINGGKTEKRKLILQFEKNKLVKIN